VLERRRDLDLLEETIRAQQGGQLRPKQLDRYPAVMLEVFRQVDRRHTALAHLTLDAVAVGEGGGQVVDTRHQCDSRCAAAGAEARVSRRVCGCRWTVGVIRDRLPLRMSSRRRFLTRALGALTLIGAVPGRLRAASLPAARTPIPVPASPPPTCSLTSSWRARLTPSNSSTPSGRSRRSWTASAVSAAAPTAGVLFAALLLRVRRDGPLVRDLPG